MRSILLCLLLVMSSLCEAEDEATWSKPVNGLRGRLQVLAPPPSDPSFCRVFLELENTENVMGQRKVRFAADKLSLQVIDKDGRPLEVSHNPYDGFSTSWEPLLLPFGATIRFPVNMHGLAYRKDPPQYIIDMGVENSWIIPPTGDYFLTGTLTIPKTEGGPTVHFDWSGTITFPKVPIPKAK